MLLSTGINSAVIGIPYTKEIPCGTIKQECNMSRSSKSASVFKAKWELECGVKVASRNPISGQVEGVICLFCRAFGREEPDEGDERKRKRTQNIQSFKAPWRIDKLKKHHKAMHPKKWAEYQECSAVLKKHFFDAALEAKPANSVFLASRTEKREIEVDKSIVENIIEDLLFYAEDDKISKHLVYFDT